GGLGGAGGGGDEGRERDEADGQLHGVLLRCVATCAMMVSLCTTPRRLGTREPRHKRWTRGLNHSVTGRRILCNARPSRETSGEGAAREARAGGQRRTARRPPRARVSAPSGASRRSVRPGGYLSPLPPLPLSSPEPMES